MTLAAARRPVYQRVCMARRKTLLPSRLRLFCGEPGRNRLAEIADGSGDLYLERSADRVAASGGPVVISFAHMRVTWVGLDSYYELPQGRLHQVVHLGC